MHPDPYRGMMLGSGRELHVPPTAPARAPARQPSDVLPRIGTKSIIAFTLDTRIRG